MKPSLNHPSRNDFSAHILLELEEERRQHDALVAYGRRERMRQQEVTGTQLFKFFAVVCFIVGIALLIARNLFPESF